MITAPPSDRSATAAPDGDAQLDRAQFAKLAGYSAAGTITSMLMRAQKKRRHLQERIDAGENVHPSEWEWLFPEPDGHLGRTPYWRESTVRLWMQVRRARGSSSPPEGAEAETGPGDCPICGKYCPGSVAAHRTRRDKCSYDPEIRLAAARNPDQWDEEKAAQSGPGTCPVCHEHFESVTAHRMQKHECSFNPAIRSAARA